MDGKQQFHFAKHFKALKFVFVLMWNKNETFWKFSWNENERVFTPSGPEKKSSNKTVSKIDNVSVKHSGFDETAFFNRKKVSAEIS